jgi:hypothetical protein
VGCRLQVSSELTRNIFGAVLLATMLLLLGFVVITSDAQASNPFNSFPLGRDVPGGRYATLDEGVLPNETRWAVYASRLGKSKAASQAPCISVARITRSGRYGNGSRCAPVAYSGPSEPPVYVAIAGSGETRPGGPVVGETVMGLSFSTNIVRVELYYASGGRMLRHTRLLNPKQQRKTRLAAFRYVALGMLRDVCVASVKGFDVTGAVVLERPTEVCPSM